MLSSGMLLIINALVLSNFNISNFIDNSLYCEDHNFNYDELIGDFLNKELSSEKFPVVSEYYPNVDIRYEYNKYADKYMNCYYSKVYNYRSHPNLVDTDFDGRNDYLEKDEAPLDSSFKSVIQTSHYNNVKKEYVSDNRYFFLNPREYYAELSEYAMLMSNMIRTKNGKARNITYSLKRGSDSRVGIKNFLEFHGYKNIREGTAIDSENNVNRARYALASSEVDYYGNHKTIINCVIGDFEDNTINLKSNYDGSVSTDESTYETYHHIGYDIVANKIYSKLKEYDDMIKSNSTKDSEYVYLITGYGDGGSIANLLGKKWTDDNYIANNTFVYTFDATNTINTSALTHGEKINNRFYSNIFNVKNTDNYTLYVLNRDIGFTMYGVSVEGSLNESNAGKKRWGDSIGKGKYGGVISVVLAFKNECTEYLKELFSFEETGKNKVKEVNELIEKPVLYILNINFSDILKHLVSIVSSDTRDELAIFVNEPEVMRIQETIALDMSNGEIDISDERDGIGFKEYDIEEYKSRMNFDNKKNEDCVRVGLYAYSNYTVKGYDSFDLDYSKFWSTGKTDSKLYKYKMGDYGANTKCTYSDYNDSKNSKTKTGVIVKDMNTKIATIDDRIIAAFPIPIFSKGTEDISQMHRYNLYYGNEEDKYHGFNGKYGMNEDNSTLYNLVDAVFEKYDTEGGAKHQFVVPFIVIDTKWLHQSKEKDMYSMFTDNRYGQVTENIITPALDKRIQKDTIKYVYRDSEGVEVEKDKLLENKEASEKGLSLVGKKKTNYDKNTNTVENTYPNYYDDRNVVKCSPIEPYIDGKSDNDFITSLIINQIYPGDNTRLVSIRVYDVDFEEQLESKNWRWNVNTNVNIKNFESVNPFDIINTSYYSDLDKDGKKDIIVKYPAINNSE